MCAFKSIEEERRYKIESIQTDQLERERDLFYTELGKLGLKPSDKELIERALQFTISKDYGSTGKDRYYATHPVRVARFLTGWLPVSSKVKVEAVVTALVHNALEKEIVTPETLGAQFGSWVQRAVMSLTLDRVAMQTEEGKKRYYNKLNSLDPEIAMIKVLDKFDNILSLSANPDDQKREEYLTEVELFVLPLARQLAPDFAPYLARLVENTRQVGYVLNTIPC
jgi:(p)ppGpp synthase/HD superfamily hydrolase